MFLVRRQTAQFGKLFLSRLLRRDEDRLDEVNDAFFDGQIGHADLTRPVDVGGYDAVPIVDVHTKVMVSQVGREVYMILAGSTQLFFTLWWVVGISEEGVVGNEVILQQRFQVLLAVSAEQECVDLRAKSFERMIRWSENGGPCLRMTSIKPLHQAGFGKTKVQCTELLSQEVNGIQGRERGN